MRHSHPLPLPSEWEDTDSYVNSLLSFATTSDIFRHLCGGVHILDFLTRDPDLYTSLIPEDWRLFFEAHEIGDILHLLMREDIECLRNTESGCTEAAGHGGKAPQWRGGPVPPSSLLEYIHNIRKHSLKREFTSQASVKTPKSCNGSKGTIPRNIAVGMKDKKVHEVENFARYVDSLTTDINHAMGHAISHIADFGSGQNYLGRTLASNPYNRNVIAIERKHHNISGARDKDVHAKLAKKKPILRNKKLFVGQMKAEANMKNGTSSETEITEEIATLVLSEKNVDAVYPANGTKPNETGDKEMEKRYKGSMDYIEHNIQDGYLEPIIRHVVEPESEIPGETEATIPRKSDNKATIQPRVMVISLHSCGNLVHHGVRSLVLNPSVSAVAMIGCCYNLMTERLGPPTYKLPALRSQHPRLESESGAYDPHGFPMSHRLETYPHEAGQGIKLNITARMMAVQAPYNWGPEESEAFFTRHFFRALLQRVFLDTGVVEQPRAPAHSEDDVESKNTPGTALIIGSLRKAAFTSFTAYVRAAVAKAIKDRTFGPLIEERVSTLSDEQIEKYFEEYLPARKNLSVVWSLMAFSAGVIESIIVVDRWLFLREQESVKDCWVEPVFDYGQSPRNLAVVGIKK